MQSARICQNMLPWSHWLGTLAGGSERVLAGCNYTIYREYYNLVQIGLLKRDNIQFHADFLHLTQISFRLVTCDGSRDLSRIFR